MCACVRANASASVFEKVSELWNKTVLSIACIYARIAMGGICRHEARRRMDHSSLGMDNCALAIREVEKGGKTGLDQGTAV